MPRTMPTDPKRSRIRSSPCAHGSPVTLVPTSNGAHVHLSAADSAARNSAFPHLEREAGSSSQRSDPPNTRGPSLPRSRRGPPAIPASSSCVSLHSVPASDLGTEFPGASWRVRWFRWMQPLRGPAAGTGFASLPRPLTYGPQSVQPSDHRSPETTQASGLVLEDRRLAP